MPRTKAKIESVNSSFGSSIKPTEAEKQTWKLKALEERLYKASSYHLWKNVKGKASSNKGALALHKEMQKHIDEIVILAEKIKGFSILFSIAHRDKLELLKKDSENDSKRKAKGALTSRGRPNVHPDIALLLYAALESGKGDRSYINKVGKLIAPNGPLQLRIDSKFHNGAFEALHFPTPNFEDERWERATKESLKRFALEFVFGKNGMLKTKYHLDESASKHFRAIVKRGGFSQLELEQQNDEFQLYR